MNTQRLRFSSVDSENYCFSEGSEGTGGTPPKGSHRVRGTRGQTFSITLERLPVNLGNTL